MPHDPHSSSLELDEPPLLPDLPEPLPLFPDLPLEDDESSGFHPPHPSEDEELDEPQSPDPEPDDPLPLLPDLPLPEPLFPLLPEDDESDLPHPQSGEEDDDDDHPPETSCAEVDAAIRNRVTFILY